MRRITEIIFICVLLGGFIGAGFCAAVSAANSAPSAMLSSTRVPFVANEGQITNPEVKYYAKTFGGTVYALSDGRIVYSLPKYDAAAKAGARVSSGSVILQERLRGNFAAEPLGAGKSPVTVNSFIGDRPEKWKTNLPVFDRLDFGEVYEGISLLLSARGNNVEKIFVVSPGADPREITFGFEGASGIEVTDEGELELRTALGCVYFTRPVAWQIDAQGKYFPVTADYALDEDGQIRFELSSYDSDNILVIDPLLASTFVGGSGADAAQAMAVDSRTNVYVAGYTDSSDFPGTNSSSYQPSLAGGQDAFVSKFDANLGSLSASTYLGGSSNDQATAIGIDASSNIWLAGYTESTNFPTASAMDSTYNGNGDVFVAVLPANLGTVSFQATYLGGTGADSATAITMDNLARQQYIVGYTESANFPVTNLSGYVTNYSGARDAFAVVFSNNVTSLKGGTFLGGTNLDQAAGVVVTPGTALTNSVYIVGFTSSTNYPVTNGNQMIYRGGSYDAFVSKLSALLTNLPASTFLGGTGSDLAYAVALDISNRVYVAGATTSTNFPCYPASNNVYLTGWTNAYRSGQDMFVTCLTNNISNLYASTYIGGTGDDVAKCLVVDTSSATSLVYLAGYTTSSNFPTTRAAYDRSYNGGEDAFTLQMNDRLTNMYASTYLGGGANDQALALALGPESNTLFVAGITASSDFPASDAAYETAFRGGASDGFITKFPASLAYGTIKWRKYIQGICSSPALTWDGTVVAGVSTALNAYTRSGAERWPQLITASPVAEQFAPVEGLGVPAVGTNGFIYINTEAGQVYAITPAGVSNLLFNGASGVFWSAPALDSNGRIFFSQLLNFYSVSQDGICLWTNSLPQTCKSPPSVSSNGTIYAVASDPPAELYAFDANGSTSHIWTTTSKIYSSPALAGTNIYVVSTNSRLYAFNNDGTTARTWTAAGEIFSSPVIGPTGAIYIGGGNNLYSFNSDGSSGKVWRAGGEIKSSAAIDSDGSIIVGATNGFYSFNPDGTTNWFLWTDGEVQMQAPLIDSEGIIYATDNFYIYAIYGSQPLAESGWPVYRHDSLRTANQGMDVASFLRPTGLSVSKGTITNYVRVGWNASDNALNYELWRSPTNLTATAGRIRRLTQTNYNDSSIDPGKVYYYWVKVKTPVALSAFSASDSGGVPPYPPAGVAASDGVPTDHVQVTWQASSNATTYYVYRSLSSATNTAEEIGSTSATNYDDYTLAPGLRHYYWVKAENAEAGRSGFSESDHGGIPCWAPSGFSASQGASVRSVALSWNISTGAESYVVFRNTEDNSGTAGIIITNITGLGTSDSTGTPLRRYYYWAKATNEFGLSGFSASALGWSLLAPPQAVSASAGTYDNMIRVSWIAGSTDATAHVVFRSQSSDPATATWQSDVVYNYATDTNYDDTAITRGPDYYYWVAAKNSYGSSSWVAASAPGGTIPVTPADLNASDGAYSNMVKVTWSHSSGATYYTVYRYETFDSSYATQIGLATANYYDDTSAGHGTLYYYWVKAGNNYGLSALSTFNSGWRGMVPPDNVNAGAGISTTEVSVTWSAAPNAASYELWRGTDSNSASASRLANNITAISYSDRSANPGTVYYYSLKSKRGAYTSAFSESDLGYRAIGLLDIGISDFVFVPTVFKPLAHPSAVSFKVSNLSALDMVEPNNTVQYDLYLSSNTVFGSSDDYLIGSADATLPLNAGASTRVVCPVGIRPSIVIPAGASGSYYVFVFANHCLPSTWLDPNLANNEARRLGDLITIAAATALQPVWNDYDGDGKTDLAVYHESTGTWRFWLSTSGYTLVDLPGLGGAGYRAVPRDYDGDGKFDLAVYQEMSGTWRVCFSAFGYQMVVAAGLGGTGQYAVPADYDGDGCVDPAVYQESTGGWRAWLSASGYAEVSVSGIGGPGWRPVPADYDGDGKTDLAVYQETTTSAGSGQAGTWQICLSAAGYQTVVAAGWGGAGQLPVPGDYDGDGRVDPAVYQPADGGWRVWASSGSYGEINVAGWGGSGQTAVPGDYDGDGRVDPVVYWESMGIWRLWLSIYGYSEMDVLASGGVGFHAITAGE